MNTYLYPWCTLSGCDALHSSQCCERKDCLQICSGFTQCFTTDYTVLCRLPQTSKSFI